MKIKISYPPEFPLSGWDKAIFGIRVQNMFRDKWFSVCSLDDCRKSLGLQDSDHALRRELGELHCLDFKKMPPEVLDALPAKVSEFIVVEVQKANRSEHFSGPRILGGIALAAILGIAAVTLNSRATAKQKAELLPPPYPLAPALDHLPAQRSLSLPEALKSADPTFSASFSTTAPRQSIKRIAAVVPANGGRFNVEVTVTPSPGDQ